MAESYLTPRLSVLKWVDLAWKCSVAVAADLQRLRSIQLDSRVLVSPLHGFSRPPPPVDVAVRLVCDPEGS